MRGGSVFLLIVATLASTDVRATDPENETSREVEVRVRADARTRLHVLASRARRDPDHFREGSLGLAVHHAVSPQWAWRIGARALSTSEDSGNRDERRAVADVYWTRQFGGERWTLSNRNRLDLRWFSEHPFSWRLRDRVMIERALPIRDRPFVAYASGELFHDSRNAGISRMRAVAGVTVPLATRVSCDLYYQYTRDRVPRVADTGTVGLALVVSLTPGE
jgi:hypothetical protein